MNDLIEARVKSKKKPAYELDSHVFEERKILKTNNVMVLSQETSPNKTDMSMMSKEENDKTEYHMLLSPDSPSASDFNYAEGGERRLKFVTPQVPSKIDMTILILANPRAGSQ